MPIKQVDRRMVDLGSPLIASNSYITNLTSVNVSSTNVFAGNVYVNNVLKNTNWDAAYTATTVYSNISNAFITQSLTATNLTAPSISARFINLEHSVPNDGINPVLFIGERGDGSGGTVVNSLTGFNITYDEPNNKLIISTNLGSVTPLTAVAIDSSTNVGVGTVSPNSKLTVVGNISSTGSITTSSLKLTDSIYYTNTTMGSAVLGTGGTVTVNTTNVTLNSRIFVTTLIPLPNFSSIGSLFIGNRTASTSFAVSSTNVNDRSVFSWLIVEPSL